MSRLVRRFSTLLVGLACVSCGAAATGEAGDGGAAQGEAGALASSMLDGGVAADVGSFVDGDAPPVADTGPVGASDGSPPGAFPAGWLFTRQNQIFVSNGATSAPWMGRGVNVDDIFLCGGNSTLSMTAPDTTLETIVSGVIAGWKATFLRISLAMNSDTTKVSWLADPTQYKTPMTNVIQAIGTHENVYVLVTLRSDATMVETDQGNEATYIPQAGTDAVYTALVDAFAHDSFVMFGLTNEPGTIASTDLVPVLSHAVSVIRAEEDLLGVPHHIVTVQGTGWDQDISFYSASPLPYDNVVYEFHYYPVNGTTAASYTYANIPVLIGEYGITGDPSSFFVDVEAKQIPSAAWDFEPYSNCAPDLVAVSDSATTLTPTSPWGTAVQAYLTSH
jgi:hypothetical protein